MYSNDIEKSTNNLDIIIMVYCSYLFVAVLLTMFYSSLNFEVYIIFLKNRNNAKLLLVCCLTTSCAAEAKRLH